MIAGDPGAVSNPIGSGAVLACALAYYLLGCVLLVAVGTSFATLHAFAAFITLAIVAAANQLIPVLTGVPPKPPGEVIAASIPLVAGFALLILGFAGLPTFTAAAVLLGVGSIGWAVWMILRVVHVKLERAIAGVFVLAAIGFVSAALIGAGMAVALGTSHFVTLLSLAPVHAALAIGAFASCMIVAISYRFVPMFSLSHASVRQLEKAPQWLVPLAAFGGCAFFGLLSMGSLRVAAGIAFCAMLISANTHLRTLRSRMRRRFDASILYATVAWGFGLTGAALAALGDTSPHITVVAITCAILGWISISILGYAYKIVGFLAWETAKARAPLAPLPPLSKALPERTTRVALWLLGIGTALTAALPLTPFPIVLGAAVYLLGAACAAGALFNLTATYLGTPHAAYST
jgi:hypothetical protein